MEIYSKGYLKCKELAIIMASFMIENNREYLTINEIRFFISKHIGFSRLSQDRYFNALIVFGFIKKITDDQYAVI